MAGLPADMPARLKRWGLGVDIVEGWQARGRSMPARFGGVVLHHTGTRQRPGVEWPTYNVLLNGRSDLPGPLCNFGLSASGRVLLVAAGTANHAGAGGWDGLTGNASVAGIEAENDGVSPWPAGQLDAYDRLTACVLEALGAGSSMACAHFEWATPKGRKNDPAGFDMPALRSRVGHLLAHPPKAGAAGDPKELDMDEARLREIIREEVRAEVRAANVEGGAATSMVRGFVEGMAGRLERNLAGHAQVADVAEAVTRLEAQP